MFFQKVCMPVDLFLALEQRIYVYRKPAYPGADSHEAPGKSRVLLAAGDVITADELPEELISPSARSAVLWLRFLKRAQSGSH